MLKKKILTVVEDFSVNCVFIVFGKFENAAPYTLAHIFSHDPIHRAPRRIQFKASSAAAGTGQTVLVDRNVPHFSGAVVFAVMDFSSDNKPAAAAGAHGHIGDVFAVPLQRRSAVRRMRPSCRRYRSGHPYENRFLIERRSENFSNPSAAHG